MEYCIAESTIMLYKTYFLKDIESDDEYSEEELIELYIEISSNRRNSKTKVPSRIKYFIEHTVLNNTAKEFQSHFRITRQTFEWLYVMISPHLQSSRPSGRQTIDSQKQILSVLWILATPDSYRSIGSRFDMGKSSLFVCFVRVIKALNKIAPKMIFWPKEEVTRKVEEGFYKSAGIRGVIGAIDGTYVPIKAPKKDPEAYINRKCFHGITLQGICDDQMKFTDCFTGYPSSVSDVRIFKNSDIYAEFINNPNAYFGENNFIIGDKAYPNKKWCISPYIDRGRLTRRQKNFNTAHAKTRQVIERSFALLFGRFRRLKYLDMNRIDLIPATIIACCVLHNMCLNDQDDLINVYEEEGRDFVINDTVENIQINFAAEQLTHEGTVLRDMLALNF